MVKWVLFKEVYDETQYINVMLLYFCNKNVRRGVSLTSPEQKGVKSKTVIVNDEWRVETESILYNDTR